MRVTDAGDECLTVKWRSGVPCPRPFQDLCYGRGRGTRAPRRRPRHLRGQICRAAGAVVLREITSAQHPWRTRCARFRCAMARWREHIRCTTSPVTCVRIGGIKTTRSHSLQSRLSFSVTRKVACVRHRTAAPVRQAQALQKEQALVATSSTWRRKQRCSKAFSIHCRMLSRDLSNRRLLRGAKRPLTCAGGSKCTR